MGTLTDRDASRDGREASPPATPSPAVARARIRERATTIRDRQVERALSRLADGDGAGVSPEDRAAVESLADRLVDALLDPPEAALSAEDAADETVETAIRLFGRPDDESGADE